MATTYDLLYSDGSLKYEDTSWTKTTKCPNQIILTRSDFPEYHNVNPTSVYVSKILKNAVEKGNLEFYGTTIKQGTSPKPPNILVDTNNYANVVSSSATIAQPGASAIPPVATANTAAGVERNIPPQPPAQLSTPPAQGATSTSTSAARASDEGIEFHPPMTAPENVSNENTTNTPTYGADIANRILGIPTVPYRNPDLPPASSDNSASAISSNFIKKHANDYWEDYYSGFDAVITIGNIWVDDIVTLQYSKVNNKSPIYGYASEIFDAVAKGTTMIQGEFAIAFKSIEYLPQVLAQNAKNQLDVSTSLIKPSVITRANLLGTVSNSNGITAADFNNYVPDRYGYISSQFGEYIDVDGFDIVVVYGDPSESARGGTVEVISSVHITSITKICQPTGDPVAEVYSFFARIINDPKKLAPYYTFESNTNLDQYPGNTTPSNIASSDTIPSLSPDLAAIGSDFWFTYEMATLSDSLKLVPQYNVNADIDLVTNLHLCAAWKNSSGQIKAMSQDNYNFIKMKFFDNSLLDLQQAYGRLLTGDYIYVKDLNNAMNVNDYTTVPQGDTAADNIEG